MPHDSQRHTLATGRFLELVRIGHWEFAHRTNCTGAAVIVPLTDDGRLVLVEQFRIPVGKPVVELPAGLIGDQPIEAHETIEAAAARELFEEIGYAARAIRTLASGPPSAGISSEIATLLLATGLTLAGPGGGDDSEQIEVHAVPLADVPDWLAVRQQAGSLVDPKVYAGLYFAERAMREEHDA